MILYLSHKDMPSSIVEFINKYFVVFPENSSATKALYTLRYYGGYLPAVPEEFIQAGGFYFFCCVHDDFVLMFYLSKYFAKGHISVTSLI